MKLKNEVIMIIQIPKLLCCYSSNMLQHWGGGGVWFLYNDTVKISNQMRLSQNRSNATKSFGIIYSFDTLCIYQAKLI